MNWRAEDKILKRFLAGMSIRLLARELADAAREPLTAWNHYVVQEAIRRAIARRERKRKR